MLDPDIVSLILKTCPHLECLDFEPQPVLCSQEWSAVVQEHGFNHIGLRAATALRSSGIS